MNEKEKIIMKKTIKMITGMTLAGAIMFSTVTTVSASVTGSMVCYTLMNMTESNGNNN